LVEDFRIYVMLARADRLTNAAVEVRSRSDIVSASDMPALQSHKLFSREAR
jgi:hypothetical protein